MKGIERNRRHTDRWPENEDNQESVETRVGVVNTAQRSKKSRKIKNKKCPLDFIEGTYQGPGQRQF